MQVAHSVQGLGLSVLIILEVADPLKLFFSLTKIFLFLAGKLLLLLLI